MALDVKKWQKTLVVSKIMTTFAPQFKNNAFICTLSSVGRAPDS